MSLSLNAIISVILHIIHSTKVHLLLPLYCYAMCQVSLDSSDEMWPRVLIHDVIIPYTL